MKLAVVWTLIMCKILNYVLWRWDIKVYDMWLYIKFSIIFGPIYPVIFYWHILLKGVVWCFGTILHCVLINSLYLIYPSSKHSGFFVMRIFKKSSSYFELYNTMLLVIIILLYTKWDIISPQLECYNRKDKKGKC